MSRRYYKMTPARRAALRRAQKAAAAKRRRRRRITTATVGVAVVSGSAIAGNKVRNNLYSKRYSKAHSDFVGRAMAAGMAKSRRQRGRDSRTLMQYGTDVSTFGRTRIGGGVAVDIKGRQRGNRYGLAKRGKGQAQVLVPDAPRGFKVNSRGRVVVVKRLRGLYDNNRRWSYDSTERSNKYYTQDKPRIQAKSQQRKAKNRRERNRGG